MGIPQQDDRKGDQRPRTSEEKILGEGNLVDPSLRHRSTVHPPRAGYKARMPDHQFNFDR